MSTPSTLPALLIGLALGMRHATDPDHVVAVATIASRSRSIGAAAKIGAVWGVGHTLTMLLFGGAIILFELVIPTRLGLSLEFAVSLMLVGLGAWTLLRAKPDHHHHHHAAGPGHTHEDARAPGLLRPLIVGVVHGLAGSAAVALLVLATLREPAAATAYLLLFGLGTIAGMLLVTAAVAAPMAYTAARFGRLNHLLVRLSAAVSLGYGLFLVYETAICGGLFSANPTWIPS